MTAAITLTGAIVAGAAAVSAGVGIYSAVEAGKQTSFADGLASTQFGEQQQFAGMLMQLLQNPESFASNPAYKFASEQGGKQVAANMSASGYAGSGNEALALQQFGQQSAYQGLASQEQMLSGLTGLQASSSNAQNVQAGTSASQNSFNQFLSMLPILGATAGGVGNLFSSTPNNNLVGQLF
jgi:hypothetical protein